MKNKIILAPLLLLCFFSFSMAISFENKENFGKHWIVYDNKPEGASIENLFDTTLNSNVIEFKGEGRRNAYCIGSKRSSLGWNNTKGKILKWKMNFSEKFKISVYVKTKKGYRVFQYTHKDKNKGFYKKRYIGIGLGKKTMDGTWQSISRNLEADLKNYEPSNKLLSVNGVKIQGSGKIDDFGLVSATVTDNFPKNILLDGKENPEDGVYVKYTEDKKKAYIFINQESRYFDKYKGLISVDISEKEHPVVMMQSTRVYSEPSNFFITENGKILIFTYTDTHQYLGTLNLDTLEFVESIRITMLGFNSWANLYNTNTNVDLYYTSHSTPEKALYTYYHISDDGDISKISGINPGGMDRNFIWTQGAMAEEKYFITYLEEHASGSTQYLKFTKKIYDVSNLPDMPLIDTIITEEERPL